MSSNAKKSGPTPGVAKNKGPPLIYANYALRDGLVHMVSSQKFYFKQMQWCMESVSDFWLHIVRVRRGVLPDEVPMSLRFCISWLTGYDCTNWSAREVCGWLQHNIGHDSNGLNGPPPIIITRDHGNTPYNGHRVVDLPENERPAVSTPLRVPTVTLPPPQFLFPAMPPPEDADASSAVIDVPEDADASSAAVDVGTSI